MTVTDLIESLQALPPDQPIDWTLPDLADGIPTMFRAQNQLAALRMDAIAAFDARGGAQIGGYRTTADWLGKTTGIPQPGAMVNTARALRDELPHTAAALAAGDITEEHLAAIRRAHRMLAEDFPTFEKTVVDYATSNTVKNLRGYTDLLISQYRPDDFDGRRRNPSRQTQTPPVPLPGRLVAPHRPARPRNRRTRPRRPGPLRRPHRSHRPPQPRPTPHRRPH